MVALSAALPLVAQSGATLAAQPKTRASSAPALSLTLCPQTGVATGLTPAAQAPSTVIDGAKIDVNGAYGHNFGDGRGNITVYGGFRKTNPVTQDTRDVSACALDPIDDAGTGLTCGGSSNNPWGLFTLLTGPNKGKTLNNTKDGQHTWVPYDSSFLYNYAPTNYFQRSDKRYTAGAFAKYKFADAVEAYGSFMYMNDHTFSQAAPSALFQGTTFTINCNNPYLSASQAATLCGPAAGTAQTEDTFIGLRLSKPRRDDLRHEDFRYTAGLRGQIAKGFSYDVNYLRSEVRYDETYMNNVDNVKAQKALNVVNVNGTPTCQSVIDGSDPSCLPIDVFAYNAIAPANLPYIFSNSSTKSRNKQTVISGTINGDLGEYGIKSPWSERGVGIALGGEHRRESLVFTADAIAQQNGTSNSDGVITVNEGYGEIEVPILADLPFAKDLTINGGARYSSYHNQQNSTGFSSDFNVWTYKAELSWAPTSDLRLRASYNHAIRAPNISELFGAVGLGNVTATDPCAGSAPTLSLEVCERTGVTAAQYGSIPECPAGTCVQQFGGNRDVKPEKADTYTVGVILTPRKLRNFSLSVDYFHIKIKDYISSIDPSLTISQCATTGDPYYCGLFHRDPRSGVLFGNDGYVVGTTLNTGYLMTSGVDITSSYNFGIGTLGKIDLDLVGTYIAKLVTEPLPGLGSYDCKGLYGYTCGEPSLTWRHQLRTTWEITEQAYRNYLSMLGEIPRYFDQQIVNMKAGEARGFTPPKITVEGRDATVASITDPKTVEENPFYAPFAKMPAAIPAATQAELRAAGAAAISNKVIPAHKALLAFLRDDYIPHAKVALDAYSLPDGKAYYQSKIKEFTTLDLTPQQIHEIGLDEVAKIHAEMLDVMKEVKFQGNLPAFLTFLRTDPRFYAKTPDELLKDAAWIAKRFDGKAKDWFGHLPRSRFAIIPVPADIAPFYTGGRGGPGVYLVNTYNLPSRPLYSLTALTLHESAPGHAFQMPLAAENKDLPPFRQNTYISAYGEGWALYCEKLGVEMDMYETPYDRFGMLSYQMWRAARLVVDTGIHSQGWSREQAQKYLHDNTALADHEIETEVDRYIAWPGQALSYYLGEKTILDARAKAEKALGPKFNIRAFHDTVLQMGSVPMPVLQARIDRFIAEGGKGPYPDEE